MKPDPKDVGKRIRSIRQAKGLTMEEFGNFIDKANKSAVGNWERGDNLPNNKRLKLVAQFGDMSVNELLYGPFVDYARERITQLTYDKEWSAIFSFSDENRKDIVEKTMFQVSKKGIAKHFYDIGEFSAVTNNLVNEMLDAATRRQTNTEFTNSGLLNRSSYDLSEMMRQLEEYRDNGVDTDVYKDVENIIENANDKLNGLYEKYKDRLKK